MKKVGFATHHELPNLTDDDRTMIEQLRDHQIAVQPVIWDAENSHMDDVDGIIIRSCWNYHLKPREFLGWVRQAEERGVPLWNPARVVEWNSDKVYLKRFHEKGVPIPQTVFLEKNSKPNLAAILDEMNLERAVVKPTISATAYQTWVTTRARAQSQQAMLEVMVQNSGVMVQAFVDEILTRGEWSFIFFHKEFSHSVLKRAKPGDFRVQANFGGHIDKTAPSPSLIEQAQRIVDLVEEPLLFARVDGVDINGLFHLIELELIEPALFLREDSLASQRFAKAIAISMN